MSNSVNNPFTALADEPASGEKANPLPRTDAALPRWDLDFSLALYNRTGKYFIGRDLLRHHAALFCNVYYWRLALPQVPGRNSARIIGRLEALEHRLRGSRLARLMPKRRRPRPVLHLDPLTVINGNFGPEDIVLCHDMGPLTHPSLFSPGVTRDYETAFRHIAEVGPAMVFVSKASAQAYARLYGEPRRQRVIYPPIRIGSRSGEAVPPEAVEKPFLLTVGSIGDRKNQLRSIEAFRRSGLAERGFSYILCGKQEPGFEKVQEAAADASGVIMLPYVTDAELRWLYRNAAAFVLPSLLEGFGMPVAEAMQNGLLPIVSAGSVLEEVAGGCCIAVDPTDAGQIADAMIRATSETAPPLEEMEKQLNRFSEQNFREAWREALMARPCPG